MRSLFLVNSLCVGGAEKQVVALVNGLAARAGHTVLLQCLKQDNALLPQLSDKMRQGVLPCLDVRAGVELPAVRALARRLDTLQVDALVCTNMYALLYGSLARAASRRARALRLVEVFHTTDVGSRKEQWSMVLYRRLVRSADLLVYVCHAQARHWAARGLAARNEAVIHNGIDGDRFRDTWSDADKAALRALLGFGPQDVVFGLCAVMRPEKAHDDLLAALATLRGVGVSVPLRALLIGDGPLRAAIEGRIAQLGLADAVRITGMVGDVRPWVAACDAMVLPSHAVETFSIAALESMAMGKPMVMTRIGGAQEQVDDGVDGCLYTPGDVDALARALAGLADRERCREMGRVAARRTRARYGNERMVDAYAATLEALAQDDDQWVMQRP